jgi:hypothetical protein
MFFRNGTGSELMLTISRIVEFGEAHDEQFIPEDPPVGEIHGIRIPGIKVSGLRSQGRDASS